MFTSLLGHFIDWIKADIVLTLLATMIGVGAIAQALAQAKTGSLAGKARALSGPILGVVILIGVITLFRPVLNANTNNFLATHGSLSDANLQSAQTIWGRPHVQRELVVAHVPSRCCRCRSKRWYTAALDVIVHVVRATNRGRETSLYSSEGVSMRERSN